VEVLGVVAGLILLGWIVGKGIVVVPLRREVVMGRSVVGAVWACLMS